MATSFMHQYIYTLCVVSCLSRPTGGDSFYEYWMFFGRELLQPVEIKIQTGKVNLERSPRNMRIVIQCQIQTEKKRNCLFNDKFVDMD